MKGKRFSSFLIKYVGSWDNVGDSHIYLDHYLVLKG